MNWLRVLFRRKRLERQLDAEIEFHLEQQTRDYIAAGLAPEEARRKARLALGGAEVIKEECRDVRPLHWLDDLLRDLRFGLRTFLRNPGFTAVSIVTLGLGIGATTAIFTVVQAMLLRPLPFPDPERLVLIRNSIPSLGGVYDVCRMSQFREWHAGAASFDGVAAYNAFFKHLSYNLTGRGEPERLAGMEVSQSLFPLLGAEPAAGRLFREGEDLPGAALVAVLSHELWQRRFGGSPSVVGETLTLNDRQYTVAGVLPAGFRFTSTFIPGTEVDLYLPLIRTPRAENFGNYLTIVGRLRSDVSLELARSELVAINQGLAGSNPAVKAYSPALIPLAAHVAGPVRNVLHVLLATVAFMLLAGCANLANLFLARGTSRTREIGLRLALGVRRGRLMRQLLTETLVIAIAGGALGVGIAAAGLRLLRYAESLQLPRLAEVELDSAVLVFAIVLCVTTTLLCGLAPALQGVRLDLVASLKEGGREATSVRQSQRLRGALVVAQVALSMILLVGAGLLVRSLHRLLEVNPGFRPERVLAFRLDRKVSPSNTTAGRSLKAFLQESVERASALSGVESAAVAYNLPLDRNMRWDASIEGKDYTSEAHDLAWMRFASPGYFRTMGIPIVAGRDFDPMDGHEKPYVAIVNQTFARKIEAVGEPLRSRLVISGRPHQVIGIVSDVRHRGLDRESDAEVYLAYGQRPMEVGFTGFDLVVKTSVDPASITSLVRREIWAMDPNQPVGRVVAMTDLVDSHLSPRWFVTWLLGAFAALAFVISTAGIYAVASYNVSRRTHEIGIRMALGARAADVERMILREAGVLGLTGIVIGIAGALALAPLLSTQLYGVGGTDPLTFSATSALLLAAVLLACYVPAHRATRLDPRSALLRE